MPHSAPLRRRVARGPAHRPPKPDQSRPSPGGWSARGCATTLERRRDQQTRVLMGNRGRTTISVENADNRPRILTPNSNFRHSAHESSNGATDSTTHALLVREIANPCKHHQSRSRRARRYSSVVQGVAASERCRHKVLVARLASTANWRRPLRRSWAKGDSDEPAEDGQRSTDGSWLLTA